MKKLLFISLVLLYSNSLSAQDTIVKNNYTRILAKVLEINQRDVKYKKFANPDGPLYIIDRKDVSRIIYSNGTVDTLSGKQVITVPENVKSDPRVKDFGLNYFSANVADVVFGFASIGYERILKSGKFGIKIPVSIGFKDFEAGDSVQYGYYSEGGDGKGYYNQYKIYSTGLDFYYYTGGQGTLRYFIGPCIEFGQFYYKYFEYTNSTPYSYKTKKEIGNYGAIIFKNGLLFQPTKSFNVSLTLGAGFYQQKTKYNDSYTNNSPSYFVEESMAIEFGLNIGYKF
jgi:hypothetical protein